MALADAASHIFSSVQSTVWTCVTTIFLCTWAAYHPNVPDPNERWWKTLLKHIVGAISALLSPEAVLMAALSDRVFSRRALQRLKRAGKGQNWCQMHGSFAYMGGFQIKNADDTDGEVLYKYEFFRRVMEGEIEMPKTTIREIRDKSKTDGFGKFIVFLQVTWFIIKFVFGPLGQEPMIPLGSFTLSLVLINSVCYAFWWNKPTNVSVPFPVYRRDQYNRQSALHEGKGSIHRSEDIDPEDPTAEIPTQPSSPEKGLGSHLRTTFLKVTLFIFLTVCGALLSGVNFFASTAIPDFGSDAKDIVWFLASAVVCLCSVILYLIFFSIAIFRKYLELPGHSKFWKLVFVMSFIISCARLCLLGLAIARLLPFQSQTCSSNN